ncbi:TM2 domain-containing protein [Candidatus Peregrinibacteria bacterium]|nr:TM2 domain-containing protein [Candidatus Peregrinibacteria bacterium]
MTTSKTKACPFCAEEIKVDAKKCKHCGEFLNPDMRPPQHAQGKTPNPGVAAVLSVFLPGLGHIYCGRFGIGFAFMFLTPFGYLFFILPGLLIHIAAIYTAYTEAMGGESPAAKGKSAHHHNQRTAKEHD